MYAVLDADGIVETTERTLRSAVEAAEELGADDVVIDAAGDGQREPNPTPDGRGALKQLRTPYQRQPLRIPDSAIDMPISEAFERLQTIMPPFTEHTKKGPRIKYPARNRTALVNSFLGQNAKTEKKKGDAEDVDVQGISLTPYWMFAEAPAPAGLGLKRRLPNLCSGSSKACRNSCLVFSGQNWAADWSIYSKFQKTQALFADPESFGRVLYEACLRHQRNAPKAGFFPAIRLNVLSDVPWELVFPALFEALPDLQFYDYTKIHGRTPPPNYDLTFSNSGGNLHNVKRQLAAGGRVAVVAHVPRWRAGAPISKRGGESDEQYEVRKDRAVHELWSDRLPESCSVNGTRYQVIDGDVNDVRFLDPSPSIIALRWKDPGGKAAWRAREALAISQRTKFVVEVEDFCGMLIGAVTPSEQPDTTIQTVFDLDEVRVNDAAANPSGTSRRWGTRRAGYANPYERRLVNRLLR